MKRAKVFRRKCDSMVTEIALIEVKSDTEESFVQTFRGVFPVLQRQEGFLNARLLKATQKASHFALYVEWVDEQAHPRFEHSEEFASFINPLNAFMISAQALDYV